MEKDRGRHTISISGLQKYTQHMHMNTHTHTLKKKIKSKSNVTFTKTDYSIGHKVNLCIYKRTEIII